MRKTKRILTILGILGLVFCMETPVSATEIHQEEIHAVPEKNAVYAEEILNQESVKEDATVIEPTEIDLGDYMTEMTVGEKQLLTTTVLPMDATEQTVTYTSSNGQVASINAMGRIHALMAGKTRITAKCKKAKTSFVLTVKESEKTSEKVTGLDLGDCPKELTLGSSQILSVAVIPATATETNFSYSSSNPAVISVNELGRATALTLGSAVVTVSCGGVRESITITVVEDESNKKIPVKDIEIGDYEEELEVDSTVTLSATVLPSDATETTITYKTSDASIATVNSQGEVKGIAPGTVTIYLTAGNVTKEAKLTVKVKTRSIKLNSDYQVMKIGDTFQIKGKAYPENSSQSLSFKSLDERIATVSFQGLITARDVGNTSIIVSNEDIQVAVNVIVNKSDVKNTTGEKEKKNRKEDTTYPSEFTTKEVSKITKEMLRYYYDNATLLTIKGDGYTIYMDGKDIVNIENEFQTKLEFKQDTRGLCVCINKGEKLPGKITVDFSNKLEKEKHVYLYNTARKKYEKLSVSEIKILKVDTEGTYLFTEKRLDSFKINLIFLGCGVLAILIGVGIYIGIKKKYWFW